MNSPWRCAQFLFISLTGIDEAVPAPSRIGPVSSQMEQAKSHGAQDLRGARLRAEQILRSGAVEYGELGGFFSWHIGCIRRVSSARNGADRRGWAEFNQNCSLR